MAAAGAHKRRRGGQQQDAPDAARHGLLAPPLGGLAARGNAGQFPDDEDAPSRPIAHHQRRRRRGRGHLQGPWRAPAAELKHPRPKLSRVGAVQHRHPILRPRRDHPGPIASRHAAPQRRIGRDGARPRALARRRRGHLGPARRVGHQPVGRAFRVAAPAVQRGSEVFACGVVGHVSCGPVQCGPIPRGRIQRGCVGHVGLRSVVRHARVGRAVGGRVGPRVACRDGVAPAADDHQRRAQRRHNEAQPCGPTPDSIPIRSLFDRHGGPWSNRHAGMATAGGGGVVLSRGIRWGSGGHPRARRDGNENAASAGITVPMSRWHGGC
jgi:hypothetical protein